MSSVFLAGAAVLRELKSVLQRFFVFGAEVVGPLAFGTLHFDHVVLGHNNEVSI
jgi:hypothetical protein